MLRDGRFYPFDDSWDEPTVYKITGRDEKKIVTWFVTERSLIIEVWRSWRIGNQQSHFSESDFKGWLQDK